MLQDGVELEVLGEKICDIVIGVHFAHKHLLVVHLLLDPEILHLDMSCLAQPASVGDADGRSGVCEHRAVHDYAYVIQQ